MGKAIDGLLKGVTLTKLKKISHPKGDVFHGLKSSENSFSGFGEAYFSSVLHSEIKGWKKHNNMVMNLIVPVGAIMFYIYDDEISQGVRCLLGGEDNYSRLTIEPGYWVAFEGVGENFNLLLNIGSIEHDPTESINVSIDSFPMERASKS
jgi:dTDP-4-dehydrorhamnose 3,5-epimerase